MVVLPDPFKGIARGGTLLRLNSRATPQGLDQRSKMDRRSRTQDGAPVSTDTGQSRKR